MPHRDNSDPCLEWPLLGHSGHWSKLARNASVANDQKPTYRLDPHKCAWRLFNSCPFRKFHPVRINVVRQNDRIIWIDVCGPARARNLSPTCLGRGAGLSREFVPPSSVQHRFETSAASSSTAPPARYGQGGSMSPFPSWLTASSIRPDMIFGKDSAIRS
jgi:hypothetical protein